MKYRKKPVVIEAFCFRYDNCTDWFMDKVRLFMNKLKKKPKKKPKLKDNNARFAGTKIGDALKNANIDLNIPEDTKLLFKILGLKYSKKKLKELDL